MTLKSFPRGSNEVQGKPSTNILPIKQKQEESLDKKYKFQINENKSIQDNTIVLSNIDDLKYLTLHKYMNILGCIYKVTDYYIVIALPGQINGQLNMSNISETYTHLLKNITMKKQSSNEFRLLSDLYKKGDHIICCIKDFNKKTRKIVLSTESYLINQSLNVNALKKYSKIVVNVKGIEDHGFTLETGLKNFQAFLPFSKVTDKNNLFLGKQIICSITDIKNIENTFIAKVSALSEDVDIVESKVLSFNNLIPITKCSLIIKKILNNGLQVYFDRDKIGYINHIFIQKPMSSFKVGQHLVGKLLYILPVVKIAFFSLLFQEQENNSLSIGDIINIRRVLSYDTKGIILQLDDDTRGYIPLRHIEIHHEDISSVFSIDSSYRCQIIAYDSMSKLYICSMLKKLITKPSINKLNFEPGDKVEVTVINVFDARKCIIVSFGKNTGIVPYYHVSDPEMPVKVTVGQCVTARILEISDKIIFTLKKSLVESKQPVLYKIEDAKVGLVYDVTVFKILNEGILINFFGNLKGWIPKRFLTFPSLSKVNYVIGQTISVIIKTVNFETETILTAPVNNKKIIDTKLNIGDVVEGFVIDSSADGVYIRLRIDEKDEVAFLPAGHMSPCHEIGKLLATKTAAGRKLSATVFSIKPTIILSTTFAPDKIYKFDDLNIGDLLLCSVKTINKDFLNVIVPIEKYSIPCKVISKNIDYFESIYKHQILFSKVLDINKKTKEINLSIQLSKVWHNSIINDFKIMTAIDLLNSYLNKNLELSNNIYYNSKHISELCIGQHINGVVETVMDNGLILKLNNNLKGIVRKSHYSKNYKPGDKVEGSIIWINYPQECIEITLLSYFINNINSKQNNSSNIPIGIQLRGEIVLINDWFILVVLKGQGKGTLVTLPARRHLNDTSPDLTPYRIGDKVRCFGVLNKEDSNIFMPICILKSVFERQIFYNEKFYNFPPHLKRKFKSEYENNILPIKKFKVCDEKELLNDKNNLQKYNQSSNIANVFSELQDKSEINQNTTNLLNFRNSQNSHKRKYIESKYSSLFIPQCGFRWKNEANNSIEIINSSSDSEEETKIMLKSQKKKVKYAEKKIFEKDKEREIFEREKVLISNQKPESIDEFDKLVLTNPDSSIVWIEYMAYFLQGTEIDKARAIARRALKTINFREESEKLNVWQAWLNLESRFGTSESLEEVFQDAIKTNESKKIYEHMLTVHTEAGRYCDVEKIINIIIAKFKNNIDLLIICITVLFKIGMIDKARNLMQKSYQSLPTSRHIELMIRFAKVESKFGSVEQSHSLFEEILSSYPRRLDVWFSYVDSLVKLNNIDRARKILDRAIVTTIPARKMKGIFKKYINLEEQYGTPEKVFHIKQIAKNYFKHHCSVIEKP